MENYETLGTIGEGCAASTLRLAALAQRALGAEAQCVRAAVASPVQSSCAGSSPAAAALQQRTRAAA